MKLIKLSLFLTTTVLLISCSSNKISKPEIEIPSTFNVEKREFDKDTSILLSKLNYKEFYTDSVLVHLIDEALTKNNDLKIALLNIQSSTLEVKKSKLSMLPTVNSAVGIASINRPSDNSLNGITLNQFLGQKYIEDYSSNISISWEADFWGKLKNTKEEAITDLLKSEASTRIIRSHLISSVADGYFNLLYLDNQLEIINQNLKLAENTLKILKIQFEVGSINSLAVEQQEVFILEILKSIPLVKNQIIIQENQLLLLAGSTPSKINRISKLQDIVFLSKFSEGVPAQLLSNRPDIKVKEFELRKNWAKTNLAKINMYPAVNITAQGGINSFKSENWFNIPSSLFGLVTGSILQPIFNGKKLKTKYEQQKVATLQAEISFKQSFLFATVEVTNLLNTLESIKEQEMIAQKQVEKANILVTNSLKLYSLSETTYLEVISAQSNKLKVEIELAIIHKQKFVAIGLLYKALGGGAN
ncbi:TolC family protein [Flavobacterium turcicum]|uniref:TolC family protein n=1 Tax=Flavobacterium turcicum TaxID=2764718 RepID=A0ABR7JEC1_9FLAO|nr:TolC family protein [Flavobacterium turcicum]MBC5862804.1 TolC family protein [Flavobacterium turcicum]NHL01536.1 TolC family protein [Flavobacterium turcicum]